MKITNIQDIETFAKLVAELVREGVCFDADATRLIIELTGGH